jgi:stage III sporulation protein AE
LKKIFIVLFFLILYTPVVFGQELNVVYESLISDATFDISSEVFPEFQADKLVNDLIAGKGTNIAEVLKEIGTFFIKSFLSSVKLLFTIVLVAFSISVVRNIQLDKKSLSETSFYISYSVYGTIILYVFAKSIYTAKNMLDGVMYLIGASLPVLLSTLSFSGGFTSSALIASSLMSMIEVINIVIHNIVFPLIMSSVILALANGMSDKVNISTMVKVTKQSAKWILGFCLAIYTGFYGIYGLTGAALDNRIGKAAKFAVGNGIPLVGGVVSESMETVMSTIGACRNLIGTAGIVCICVIALTPIIKTFVYMWIFKIAAIIIEPVSDNRIVNFTNDVSESISMISAVLIAVCLLFIGCIGIILIAGNFLV